MRVRALEQLQIERVRHLAGERHAALVVAAGEFLLQVLAPGARGQAGAVAHVIAADQHHLHVRAGGQQRRQSAHHDMEAAIRLEVAHHVGHQPVGRRDGEQADGQILCMGGGIGAAQIEPGALGQQPDAAAGPFGVSGELPPRGRLAVLVQRQGQQVDDVHGADAGVLGGIDREFRVVADILAVRRVVELEIAEDRCCGPDIGQVEQLAPAVMADDDVGREAERAQVGGDGGDQFGAVCGEVELAAVDVGGVLDDRRQLVVHPADAGDVVAVRLRDEDDLVVPVLQQMADDVQILAGEVLVDEQELHRRGPQPGGTVSRGRPGRAA